MSYTFKNLQDQVLAFMDEEGDTGTVLTNVKNALNQSQINVLTSHPWGFMRETGTNITLVPGTLTYSLPTDFERLSYIYNTTKKHFMEHVPDRQVDSNDTYAVYGDRTSGTRFTIEGRTLRLLFNPADADVLAVEYFRSPTLMSADGDIPDIPFPFSAILMWDALLMMKVYAAEPSGAQVWAENRDRLLVGLFTTYGQWAQGLSGDNPRVKFYSEDAE